MPGILDAADARFWRQANRTYRCFGMALLAGVLQV